MSPAFILTIVFIASLVSGILSVLAWEARMTHECHGTIVMHEDQVYLSLTKDDMEAFQHSRYATVRLVREKFRGFNEP